MSTIFLTAPNTHDNIANIVMKSSWEAVKTLQLNSHETSLNNGQKTSDAHFTRVSEVLLCLLALFWLYLRNFDR